MGQRALLGLLGSLIFCSSAWAGQDLRPLQPLPQLSACTSTLHPRLPQQWRATYLMAPFTIGQLVLGEIVHDASLAATRITLYGAKRGSADFLVSAPISRRSRPSAGWRSPRPRDTAPALLPS